MAVTQSCTHSHGHRHFCPPQSRQPHTATQPVHRRISHTWPRTHVCIIMCSHSCTPSDSATVTLSQPCSHLAISSYIIYSQCQSQPCHHSYATVPCTQSCPHIGTHTAIKSHSKGVTCSYTSLGSSVPSTTTFSSLLHRPGTSGRGSSWPHHPVCQGMLRATPQLPVALWPGLAHPWTSPQVQAAFEGPWPKLPNKTSDTSHLLNQS